MHSGGHHSCAFEGGGRGIRRLRSIRGDESEPGAAIQQIVDREGALDRDAPVQLLRGDSSRTLRTIRETGAGEIWVTHGREEALVHYAKGLGIKARALSLTGYEDEEA